MGSCKRIQLFFKKVGVFNCNVSGIVRRNYNFPFKSYFASNGLANRLKSVKKNNNIYSGISNSVVFKVNNSATI